MSTFDPTKYSVTQRSDETSSDFAMNLDIHPNTKDLVKVKDVAAVLASIKNLIMTDFYERPFQPMVGSRLRYSLFDNITPFTSMQIKTAIEDAIANYEKRVKIVSTIVEPDYDNNGYNVKLTFMLINTVKPIDVDLFLTRTR